MEELQRRLAVARGDEPADLVVSGGKVLSVFTREWLEADVAIADGVVAGIGRYEGREALDATGHYVVPGFIDAHMHLESVKLMVDEFARLVLPLGTTAVVADPHEIANVLGVDGVHWLLDATSGLQLDVYFMAPSCVPASPFESPRRALTPGDLESLMRRRRVLGLAEMMNFPGVIEGSEAELEKLALEGSRHVDGHAPGVLGATCRHMRRPASTRITRPSRSRRVANACGPGCGSSCARRRWRETCALCSRSSRSTGRGASPSARTTATRRTSPTPATSTGWFARRSRSASRRRMPFSWPRTIRPLWHGLRRHGAIAPGYVADLLLLPDLVSFLPSTVLKRGRPVEDVPRVEIPDWVRQSVRVAPLAPGDFAVPWSGGSLRAIGLVDDQVVTESLEREPVVEDGEAVADADRDLAKIAVVERHLATGRIGLGFVAGSGLQRGALASSVAHDAHNLVVVGMSDRDIAFAVERLAELGGGIVAVDDLRVLAECPLPVAGLLSDAPLADVIAQSRACNEAARELGWSGATPFLTLAFLALSVIPHLKITDRGLVDVDRFELVPLAVSGAVSDTVSDTLSTP